MPYLQSAALTQPRAELSLRQWNYRTALYCRQADPAGHTKKAPAEDCKCLIYIVVLP